MIVCKSQAELEKMHRAGLVIWEVLNELRGMARPGVSTKELDEYAERKTAEMGFQPPLDIVDGAARIVDPIFDGLNTGRHVWGQFLKDYRPTVW